MINLPKKGFTIIELVVAVALLSVVLLPLVQMLPTMLKTNKNTEIMTKGTFLAEQKMEEIKSLIRSTTFGYGFTKNYTQSATSFPSPNATYKVIVADNQDPNLKIIQVKVWYDKNNNNMIDSDEIPIILDTQICIR